MTASTPSEPYDFRAIERKWQTRWEQREVYRAEPHPTRETYFVLVYPPYPNGRIHMGHVRNYTIGDLVARYQRLRGLSVLHPIGFDAFGLPNEIEAGRQGVAPERLTRRNIETMARQLRTLGYSYDWKHAITTIEPEYYRWNQWLFVTLLEQGLVYRKQARVQWCPGCRTSLANEQVLDEHCWRCEERVVSRHLCQWFFDLRHYAEELWSEAMCGAFPDNIATMICDWIGKTPGAALRFPVEGARDAISVFTTKPELACGATYLALSTEHPLVASLVDADRQGDVERLRRLVTESSEPGSLIDGLDTGRQALHPLTGGRIPIWLAAYVDPDLGTGAIMGNPSHDRNDHAFGLAHGLPGKSVVSPDGTPWNDRERGPWIGDGVLYDCPGFDGRSAASARQDVIRDWEARGVGEQTTIYAIRDWVVSRQRCWGTPIPIVHCDDCGAVAVKRQDLPVRLPPNLRDLGTGNPLELREDFLICECPECRRPARRETDTMDTFLDTAWYYLRCTNPNFADSLCDPLAVARWGQADLYIGGIEISVPIMLYGSFVAKALRDAGEIEFSLPCRRLLAHEMVNNKGRKMSKSLGNTVDPQELVEDFGADSVRLLILSLAPPLKKIEWSDSRLRGCHRFLRRFWELGIRQAATASRSTAAGAEPGEMERELIRRTHATIEAVSRDIDRLQPNTSVTSLIKFLYALEELENRTAEDGVPVAERAAFREALSTLVMLLSPFTPHVCAEIWERLGHSSALDDARWPEPDPGLTVTSTTHITVKVDSKAVVRLEVPADAGQDEVMAIVHGNEAVRQGIGPGEVVKEFFVPGQIVNIVTRAPTLRLEKEPKRSM